MKKILSGSNFKWAMMAVCGLVVAGCSNDDQEGPNGPQTPDGPVTALSVIDKGFAGADDESVYADGFAAGDQIGLFAVQNGAILEEVDNLCLTASLDNGELKWSIEGTVLELPEGASYFAYAPYQTELKAEVDPSATDAEGFFAALAEAWTPATDQSGEGYAQSDLMTAMGKAGTNKGELVLEMTHRMGLVVVELPGTIYRFTNTDYTIPDYAIIPVNLMFDKVTPDRSQGVLRYLVVPGDVSLSGKYGSSQSWKYEGNVAAGKCETYKVGNGATIIEHLLQVGDFFLADGTLLSKDADAVTVGASEVIGIVFQIDPARIGEGEKEALGGTAHALVAGTRLATGRGIVKWSQEERDESEIGVTNITPIADLQQLYESLNADIEGYRNNEAIRTQRAEDLEAGLYPAFQIAFDFHEMCGGPSDDVNTTGWFVPTGGQYLDLIRNLTGVAIDGSTLMPGGIGIEGTISWEGLGNIPALFNQALSKVDESRKNGLDEGNNGVNISTTADIRNIWYIDVGVWSNGFCDYLYGLKTQAGKVRTVLAF